MYLTVFLQILDSTLTNSIEDLKMNLGRDCDGNLDTIITRCKKNFDSWKIQSNLSKNFPTNSSKPPVNFVAPSVCHCADFIRFTKCIQLLAWIFWWMIISNKKMHAYADLKTDRNCYISSKRTVRSKNMKSKVLWEVFNFGYTINIRVRTNEYFFSSTNRTNNSDWVIRFSLEKKTVSYEDSGSDRTSLILMAFESMDGWFSSSVDLQC